MSIGHMIGWLIIQGLLIKHVQQFSNQFYDALSLVVLLLMLEA